MGCSYCHFFNSNHNHLLLLLLFFLLTITQVVLLGEGRRTTSKPLQREVDEEEVVLTSKIGSRPPRCERFRRCISCGHCEAVQIPALPIASSKKGSNRKYRSFAGITTSRGDDSSNYKPLSWKCKCGNIIFNP